MAHLLYQAATTRAGIFILFFVAVFVFVWFVYGALDNKPRK